MEWIKKIFGSVGSLLIGIVTLLGFFGLNFSKIKGFMGNMVFPDILGFPRVLWLCIPLFLFYRSYSLHRRKPVFFDDFNSFKGWEKYGKGQISQSTSIARSRGKSLKKDVSIDPDGGYKKIGRTVRDTFCFSGWICSPEGRLHAGGDRLAVEGENFNGYGFTVDQINGSALIERRDMGAGKTISEDVQFPPPKENWYQFKFSRFKGGRLYLVICDSSENTLAQVNAFDDTHNEFDRVVVHGGFPYYVDDLEMRTR